MKWVTILALGLVFLLIPPATWAQEMIFHGYIDFEARNKDSLRRSESSFDNLHFNLFLGSQLADNLRAQGEIEMEHGGEEFSVEFAQIEWKPLRNDALELAFGKFVVPFGIEHRVHASPSNKLITRPLPMESIVPGTFSDAGINAAGIFPLATWAKINYSVYTINGLGDKNKDGIFQQDNVKGDDVRDINDNKSIGFQLNLIPLGGIETRGIEVGGSGLFGKWDVKDKHSYTMFGAHLIANFEPFEFRGEYVRLDVDKPGVANLKDAALSGFYVQGSWRAHKMVELIARYDSADNENGIPALKRGPVPVKAGTGVKDNRITLGILLRPQDWLAFKVEYFHRDIDSKSKDRDFDNGVGFQAVANW